jgi:hypothetical protein
VSEGFSPFSFDGVDMPVLEKAKMHAHPDLPEEVGLIELSFTEGGVFIAVDSDTDNLICSTSLPGAGAECTVPLPASFWDPLLGQALTNAWHMTNDRGYPDAVQLRFRALPNEGPYTTIQMCGLASGIAICEVKEIRHWSMSNPSGTMLA